jgi:hypothetical protein
MIFRFLGFLVLAVAVLVGVYLLAVFKYNYSSGERAGWVQKISLKGWVCKTWEGELAMSAIPGSMPEKFAFTVRDAAVAAQINQSAGQPVRLHYEQHVGLPGDCFGETGYWVDGVTIVQQEPRPGPGAPSTSGGPAPQPAPSDHAPAPAPAPAY